MLVHIRIGMAVHDQQVLPTVVVIVQESSAKAYKGNGGFRDTSRIADVGKVARSVVVEDHVIIVSERRVDKIHMPVVLIVAGGDTHVGHLASGRVHRIAALVALIVKSTISFVDVEIVRCGVVRDGEVWLAIIVHVDEQRPESVISGRIADAKLFADIGERAVSVVVKKMVTFSLDASGTAHNGRPAV